jgi:glycosyltransferase involved in cell wall biosynthesis
MKIGIAGPISLAPLQQFFPANAAIPSVASFPLIGAIAADLRERGHEISIFALSGGVAHTRIIEGDRVRLYVCPRRRERWQMPDFFRAERMALRDAMRQADCDVIHAHWTYEFGAAAVASGLPHVVTAHDVPMVVLRFARHPYWLEKPWLAVPVLRRARCVTAVSPYVAQQLHRLLRPQHDIVVVPNGVGTEVFALTGRRAARRTAETVTFASVLNGWGPRKNAKALIRAFALVRKKFPGLVKLKMIGIGFEKDGPAEKWARRHDAELGIQFVGPLPHSEVLTTLAEEADVLVHPSLEEACCMVAMEAMAIGIPVIGGEKSGGIPWELANGEAGILTDVTSSPSIAKAMELLVTDAGLRKGLGASGRRRAAEEYDLTRTVGCYETLLERVWRNRAND